MDTRDELGFGDEMVLVKMLMKIDPLPMRGSLVMTMVMISPSPGGKFPRQNSSAGALDWFRQGSASWRWSLVPKGCLLFFSHRKTSYRRRWASESHQGVHEVGARPTGGAPHPREQGVRPLAFIFGDNFSLFILRYSVEFQDFWSCAE